MGILYFSVSMDSIIINALSGLTHIIDSTEANVSSIFLSTQEINRNANAIKTLKIL